MVERIQVPASQILVEASLGKGVLRGRLVDVVRGHVRNRTALKVFLSERRHAMTRAWLNA